MNRNIKIDPYPQILENMTHDGCMKKISIKLVGIINLGKGLGTQI